MDYPISSRAYLRRAEGLLVKGSYENLFYAAFELRCGIEARMREYLDAWEHVSKRRKNGWRIMELGRSVEDAFKLGNQIVRFAIHDASTNDLKICFYHTPVTTRLQQKAERLGDVLHSMKVYRDPTAQWWSDFSTDLSESAALLRVANTGTLLGPPLMKDGERYIDMKLEIPPHTSPEQILQRYSGGGVILNVSYLELLPDPIEESALIWRHVS